MFYLQLCQDKTLPISCPCDYGPQLKPLLNAALDVLTQHWERHEPKLHSVNTHHYCLPIFQSLALKQMGMKVKNLLLSSATVS